MEVSVVEDIRGRPSFWLLADNSVSLGADRQRIGTFIASLKHALMFHERLLLSDSLVVNTPNLRRAIQEDPELREYLTTGCLVIARRRKDDRLLDLVELRENLRASGSLNPVFDVDPKPFLVDDDLKDLQRFASCIPYDIAAIRDHYSNNIVALTGDPKFKEALGNDADAVCTAILTRVQERHYLDQTFMGRSGPENLEGKVGDEVWRRVSGTIFNFQTAYYYSGIPTIVGADIVFSAEHEQQRKILRDVGSEGEGGTARVDLSRGGTSLYESVLSNMPAEKLKRLRNSAEFKEFQGKLQKLQCLKDINDPGLEPAVQEIYVALHAYHRRIDKDLYVLRHLQRGSALLDQWNLRGIVKGGGYLLRWGAEAVSDKKIRATIVSGVAECLHPGAGGPFLVYYWIAGKNSMERKLDMLPEKIKMLEDRQRITSASTTRIEGHVEIAPSAFKDTIYGAVDSKTV
jgi:hypothetical protein